MGTTTMVSLTFPRRLFQRIRNCFLEKKSDLFTDSRSVTDDKCSIVPVSTEETIDNVVEEAVNQTGFGMYNFKIGLICNLIALNVSINFFAMGFILPAATCDFKMTTIDQSYLNTSILLGMLSGTYVCGYLAGAKGRKPIIMTCLFMSATVDFTASFIPSYGVFLCLKFISGIALNGEIMLVYPYIAEFQPTKYRSQFLFSIEISWVLGLLFVPLIAWITIASNVHIEIFNFSLHSWNLFLMVCSIPSIVLSLWFCTFSETPAYFASVGEFRRMLDVLSTMFEQNSHSSPEIYIEKLRNSENSTLSSIVNRVISSNCKDEENSRPRTSLWEITKTRCSETVAIMYKPYVSRSILMSLIIFFLSSSYFTIIVWLPELFEKFATYEKNFPNETVDICRAMHSPENITLVNEVAQDCIIQEIVYIRSIILGLSCLLPGIIVLVFVRRLGFKFFLCLNNLISCGTTIGLFFVTSSTQSLILSCIYEACTSVCIPILFSLTVEVYPVNLRTTAAGLSSFCTRLGAVVGNFMFGYMIDQYCFYLLAVIVIELFLTGILCHFIPTERNSEGKNKETRDNPGKIEMTIFHSESH